MILLVVCTERETDRQTDRGKKIAIKDVANVTNNYMNSLSIQPLAINCCMSNTFSFLLQAINMLHMQTISIQISFKVVKHINRKIKPVAVNITCHHTHVK